MSLQEQLRAERGGIPYVYPTEGSLVPPLLREPPIPQRPDQCRERIHTLKVAANRKLQTCHVTPEIPEDDLHILEKIYHKEYEDCGRKRGALLRYIKHYRETAEPVNHSRRLFKHIEKLVRRSR